jgi:hypothetical protein
MPGATLAEHSAAMAIDARALGASVSPDAISATANANRIGFILYMTNEPRISHLEPHDAQGSADHATNLELRFLDCFGPR